MRRLIVHITDPGKFDEDVSVRIANSADLGRAVKAAIDFVLSTQRWTSDNPLFIDIHPADGFDHVEHHYKSGPSRHAGPN